MKKINAIILAAGESKRMKTPKMLLPYGGVTIIEKVLENTRYSSINDYIVVAGAYREEIIKASGEDASRFCYNEDYRKGMLSSVQCGFCRLPSDCSAVMILLGDQPMIGSDIIEKVVEAYRKSGKGLIVPVFKNKRGHPVIIDMKYRREIAGIDPDRGLKDLFDRYSEDIFEVEVSTSAILRDIDTREDYNREINNNL